MRSPADAAHLLMQGLLESESWPELGEETFANEVHQRLDAVGYELGYADGYWLARSRETQSAADGLKQIFQLNEAEHAVLAALYLYLRFLPRQSDDMSIHEEQPSVALEDIERGFPAYTVEAMRGILGRLRNLHFVRRYNDRLYAGPYLAVIDQVIADERSREALRDFKLRSHVRRRLQALEERIDAAD